MKMSKRKRTEKEVRALLKGHLARAASRIHSARMALDYAGPSARLETEIVAALSEMDLAERLNTEYLQDHPNAGEDKWQQQM
jgi:hypothetical protein